MPNLEPKDYTCVLPCPIFNEEGITVSGKVIFGFLWGLYHKTKFAPLTLTNGQIAQILKMSVRTVSSELNSLQERGLLAIESSKGRNRTLLPDLEYKWDYSGWENDFSDVLPEENSEWKIIRPEILELINYWNSKKGLYQVKLETKDDAYKITPGVALVVKQLNSLLKGNLFNSYKCYRFHHDRPWTLDEVKESIDNFYLAATSVEYYPADKSNLRKRSMSKFLLNTYTLKPNWLSLLIVYINPPQSNSLPLVKEVAKSIPSYLSLKKEVIETFLLNKEPTKEQDMKIIAISNRFQEWFERGKKYLPSMPMSSQWAGYVVEAALGFTQSKGQYQYDPLDTMRREWFWEAFTRFMQKKGLLSTYAIK